MFKWLSTSNKQQEVNIGLNSITQEEQQLLIQKARYRLIGVSVLFVSILITLPFIVKKPEHRNKNISIKLINEDIVDKSDKSFKKIESNQPKSNLNPNKDIDNSYM